MPMDQTQRPRFYEGQYITADDLSGIMQHVDVRLSRHLIGGHTWGISLGLDLKESPSLIDPAAVDVYLSPGYGWDGFGRPIVVLAPYKLNRDRFRAYEYDSGIDEPNGRLVEIWIGYREVGFQPPQPGFASCDAQDQSARIQETFEIYVGKRATHDLQHDPVQLANYIADAQQILQKLDPAATLIYDESIPQQTLPADAGATWLLPVGFVRWKPDPNPAVPGKFMATDATDKSAGRAFRIYIGVVAAAVEAADGIIRMKDRRKDVTRVQSPDLVWVEGDLRVQGHVSFRESNGKDDGVPFYVQRVETNAAGGRDLQLVIGKDDNGLNHLAVGPLDNAGTNFVERVTIQDDGKVGIGTTAPQDLLHVSGGNVRWANGSQLRTDEGGSIELGGNSATPGTGTPYIDFHFDNGVAQDFNARIINDAEGRLTLDAPVVSVKNNLGVQIGQPVRAFQLGDDSKGLGIEAPGDAAYIRFGDNTGRKLFLARSRDGGGGVLNVGAQGLLIAFQDNGSVGIRTDSPAEVLDVRGNIKLNSDGSLFAPGAPENLRVLRGTVDSAGNILAGTGFSVDHPGLGLYVVKFDVAFGGLPSASATQIYPDLVFSGAGMTTDNAVIWGLQTDKLGVHTGDGYGDADDRHFTFIVIGPR